MVKFTKKRIITSKLVGEELLLARKSFNLSLRAVEHKTGIAKKYLAALESGDWEALPGEVYAKNWLKKYAIFLGFEWPEIKKRFDEETAGLDLWPENINQRFGVIQRKVVAFPLLVKKLLWILLAVTIIVYLGWQIWFLLRPPYLKVFYPPDNFVFHNRAVKILGKADIHSSVILNGEKINTDENGWFVVDISLNKGLNIIKIEARKKYGPITVVERRLWSEVNNKN